VSQPLVDLKLFSNRSFAAGCAMLALQNLAMYALIFQLPFLLELLYEWGPERAGPYMTAFMVSMMAASALGGRVAERIGVRSTCVTGSMMSVAGVYWLSTLVPGEASLHVIWGLVLGGAGLGLASGPSQSAALGAIDNRRPLDLPLPRGNRRRFHPGAAAIDERRGADAGELPHGAHDFFRGVPGGGGSGLSVARIH
jgi:MFS family permease